MSRKNVPSLIDTIDKLSETQSKIELLYLALSSRQIKDALDRSAVDGLLYHLGTITDDLTHVQETLDAWGHVKQEGVNIETLAQVVVDSLSAEKALN